MLTEQQRRRFCISQALTQGEANLSKQRYAFPLKEFDKDLYKDKTVCDFGCGWGIGTFIIKYNGATAVTGIEANDQSFIDARAFYEQPSVRFVNQYMYQTYLDAESFDLVTCIETIEHVDFEERDLTIKEAWRILKSGGRFLISTPEQKNGSVAYPNGSHFYEYKTEELIDIVTGFDFELEWKGNADGHMYLVFKKVVN